MVINQQELFEYLVPAMFFLFAGVFIFNKDVNIINYLGNIDKAGAQKLGRLLIALSYLFDFLTFLGIPGISSLNSFTHYLKYVGAMACLFSPSFLNYTLAVVCFLSLAADALQIGIFIDFFMWSTYLFFMISLRNKFSLPLRILFIVVAVPILVIIQTVKGEYRKATWSGREQGGIELISELNEVSQEKEKNDLAHSSGVVKTIGRLNQGYHLGLVLRWVPNRQDFSNGEEFLSDIAGTLIPRIFSPDKKVVGGKEKFYQYTGHRLIKGTSMTIGVFGDFYINFGKWGSYIGLFLFGAFISRLLYFFIKNHVIDDPINVVWIPFLFSYLVRANNDFYIVINSFVKGYLIFLLVNFIRKNF